MTAFFKTITNQIGLFGPAPTDNWGDYNWGAFLWAEGTKDFVSTVRKVIGESLTVTDSLQLSAQIIATIQNTLTPTSDMGSERLLDGAGYLYVFPSNVTDAENRAIPSWSQGTGGSTSWQSGAATSTTWSAA